MTQDTRRLSSDPLTIETLPSGLTSDLTSMDDFFVRNNLTTPTDLPSGAIELVGTGQDGSVTSEELFEQLPRVAVTAVLQCAGNGRARLTEQAPGVQWDLGGVGCAEWSGVRLSDVVDARGGVDPAARFLTALGGDAAADDPKRVERSVPVEKALRDCLLVDHVNGAPLPGIHGGPVRLLVPGYYGVNSVKWLRRLAFTPVESDSDIQQRRYRMTPPGQLPAGDHPSLWEMSPTSFILSHESHDQHARVQGVAFSGSSPVIAVEVSTDGGDTWQQAELSADERGPYAWRRFTAIVDGFDQPLMSRAVTATATQRQWSIPTADGYAVDGYADLAYRPPGFL